MGKSPESIAFIGKIAASVLLKQFTYANEKCHNTDAQLRKSGPVVLNQTNILSMIPEDHKYTTTQ